MACVAVTSLMRTLELEFLQSQPRPILQRNEIISRNKDLVQSLHEKLGFLIELLDENRMDGIQAIKELETKLRDVAFRVEDEIESLIAKLYDEEEEEGEGEGLIAGIAGLFVEMPHRIIDAEAPQGDTESEKTWQLQTLRFRHILQQAVEDIDAIREELATATLGRKTMSLDVIPKFVEHVKMDSSSEDIMVGKTDEFEAIREMLIEHPSKQLEVVSIQGMGGIGKTTLARQVYEDPLIASHFDKKAWVVASQHHNKREMLQGLLNLKGNAGSGSDEDLAIRLYQGLKGLRYLVVMDDVWSEEAWDAIKMCFPNDINGSRVLLTTRLGEVANHTCSKGGFSHQMQLLGQSESWNLFYEKTCKSQGAEFEMIGRPVVEKCKGLPLAIIVVAGLFSKLNTLDEWTSTANALSSLSATTLGDEECSRILSLSYNHLPHNLKACFLYLGVFPEDHEINANHLARIWFAEGLVKAFENESFDVVANRYIQELMDRNLIILSKLSSCGRKIKRFRMHDLLHAFSVREAQNENLLHVVMGENSSSSPQKGFRWVSIQSYNFNMSTICSRWKSCRSLFCLLQEESSLNFKIFNLLRVLYTGTALVWLKKIEDIVHLRFLKSRCRENIELSRARGFLNSRCRNNIKSFGPWNLQTLDCIEVSYSSDDGGNYLEFPQLQYIHCGDLFYGNPPKFVRQLSWLRAIYCSKEYIMKVPYLKKVRIRGKIKDCSDCITNLTYLEQLEGLRISGGDHTRTPINNHIVLLKQLKKLTFWNIRFEWKEINILCKLPRLEVLKLLHFACIGEVWELPEKENFSELIYFAIGTTNLKHWEARALHFPKLEHLFLCFIYELEEIPAEFAEISKLKSIKLHHCLRSVVASAKQIQEEQHDQGNTNMVVIVDDIIEEFDEDEE